VNVQGRLIRERAAPAPYGLAFDEAIVHEVDQAISPFVLRLYTFLPSVIVGRYQNLPASVRIARCDELGIAYNRRHTGGGTVVMGADQLAVGLAVSTQEFRMPSTVRGLFNLFASAFCAGLAKVGLKAEFVGKNDIQVDGKKVAGLAISQDAQNAVFFHASVLIDFDIAQMLDVLNFPRTGSLDTAISCFGERMATIREYQPSLTLDHIEAAIREGLENVFSVNIAENAASAWERAKTEELIQTRYSQDEWVFFKRAPRRQCAVARRKTAGGLIEVHLALLGEAIETVLITGSFFGRIREVSRLESSLRWKIAREERVGTIVENELREGSVYRVSAEELVAVIMEAAERARSAGPDVTSPFSVAP
jgi:lipoate-protein ligase A